MQPKQVGVPLHSPKLSLWHERRRSIARRSEIQFSSVHMNPQHCESEERGVRHRMDQFYVPLFRQFVKEHGIDNDRLSVLDCGCGTGLSLDCLAEQGWTATGIDLWFERIEQWRGRSRRRSTHLLKADATELPFDDQSFDILFSCGLLEHIGVHEEWKPSYKVAPRSDQFQERLRFFKECFRVLRRPGVIYIDHPNGAFPIDFWHDDDRAARPHKLSENFLPKFAQIEQLVRAAGCDCPVEAISPANRFTFKQVGKHWWGKLLGRPFETWFQLMQVPPFTRFARSAFNPYLVSRVTIV